jgi:hypothetical protein
MPAAGNTGVEAGLVGALADSRPGRPAAGSIPWAPALAVGEPGGASAARAGAAPHTMPIADQPEMSRAASRPTPVFP